MSTFGRFPIRDVTQLAFAAHHLDIEKVKYLKPGDVRALAEYSGFAPLDDVLLIAGYNNDWTDDAYQEAKLLHRKYRVLVKYALISNLAEADIVRYIEYLNENP